MHKQTFLHGKNGSSGQKTRRLAPHGEVHQPPFRDKFRFQRCKGRQLPWNGQTMRAKSRGRGRKAPPPHPHSGRGSSSADQSFGVESPWCCILHPTPLPS
jgi:hypothetical protein